MSALIIESKNPENLKILSSLEKMLGDKIKAIDVEEIEDLLFDKMMENIKTGKTVTNDTVISSLGVK